MPPARFQFAPRDALPADTIYVDGTEPGFRSLSHWPGNTTPAPLKHDLSTGIALNFARLSAAEKERLVGPYSVVANNHYDTDGVLSVFSVLRPEEALPRESLLLAAAATGDFATWNGPEALAVELTVMTLTTHPLSPLAPQLGADVEDSVRRGLGYSWLLDGLPALLDAPFDTEVLWRDRHARILDDVAFVDRDADLHVERFEEAGLAVVLTPRSLTSIGLHHAAGDLYRVLLVHPGDGGHRYRFYYRDESWFELASRSVPERKPLDPMVEQLQRLEDERETRTEARWWAGDLAAPVVQMGYSDPGTENNGFFEDPELQRDPPSRVPVETVVETLLTAFTDA